MVCLNKYSVLILIAEQMQHLTCYFGNTLLNVCFPFEKKNTVGELQE